MPALPSSEHSPEERRQLLELARRSIEHGLSHHASLRIGLDELPASLRAEGASFVTLTRKGELRGCIGSLEPQCSLGEDVVQNAWSAAFRDTRFPPLSATELDDLELHISVLSPVKPVAAQSEVELLSTLRPGIDGVVLQQGGRRSTFLPQVWEHFQQPRDFLRALRHKAGLPGEFDPRARYYRYQVEEFGE
jgi:AmmeMemoRadiSam system protein A